MLAGSILVHLGCTLSARPDWGPGWIGDGGGASETRRFRGDDVSGAGGSRRCRMCRWLLHV